jgi:hypothetical protein
VTSVRPPEERRDSGAKSKGRQPLEQFESDTKRTYSPLFHITETQRVLGPADISVPILRYSAEPFEIMRADCKAFNIIDNGRHANKPFVVGKGGFTRGKPRFPSIDSNSAVSSPQI